MPIKTMRFKIDLAFRFFSKAQRKAKVLAIKRKRKKRIIEQDVIKK